MPTNRFLISILSTSAIVAAVMTASGFGQKLTSETNQFPLSVTPYSAYHAYGKNNIAVRPSAINTSLIIYEDFESASGVEPYLLPEGWSSVANPSFETDAWHAGTLYGQDGQLAGKSGEKYAFILPDNKIAHDAWMFSPTITLETGENYKFTAAAIMMKYVAAESLEIVLCSSPSPEAAISTILDVSESFDKWTTISGFLSVEETGEYYIGFHAKSQANSGGMVLDDITVSNVNAPIFYGERSINFNSKFNVTPSQTIDYTIWNDGYLPLEVELKEASEGIEITGLPVEVAPEEFSVIQVKLNTSEIGIYKGHITLSTNDPLSPEITLPVYQEVIEAVIGDSKMHTFDNGTPSGYTPGNHNLIGKGIRGTRGIWRSSYDGIANIDQLSSVYTNYVNLGDAPHLKFSYRLNEENRTHDDTGNPVAAEIPVMTVYITDDYEQTWTPIFKMGPDEEYTHNATTDFTKIDIDLNEYAGKCCRVRLAVGHASGDIMDLLTNSFGITFDNIMLGTQATTDLSAVSLYGPTIVEPGKEYEYTFTVENLGATISPSYTVVLEDENGIEIDSQTGTPLDPEAIRDFTFNWVTPISGGNFKFNARIEVTEDSDVSDNVSYPLHIAVISPDNRQHLITQKEDSLRMSMGQPINFYAHSSYNASLYYANEMGINRGKIESIAYNVDGAAYKTCPFKVYIGETNKSEFSIDDKLELSEMTLVFDSQMHMPSGRSDMIIPFKTPYDYKGGNIIVFTEKYGDEFVYGRWGVVALTGSQRNIAASMDTKCTDYSQLSISEQSVTSGSYPAIIFNMIEPESGMAEGIVTDENGNTLNGVTIRVKDECMNNKTNTDGKYKLSRLSVGHYTLLATCPGYYPSSIEIDVMPDSTTIKDIIMTSIPKQTVTGFIKDTDGNPVAGSTVMFIGEIGDTVVSDNEGLFTTSLYGEADYQAIITSPFYSTVKTDFHIASSPVNLNCTVIGDNLHPYNPTMAISDDNKANVSWELPVSELRHDNGQYVNCVGYDTGYSEIIFGSAYHQKAIVKEVSWYMTDAQAHDNFHVFVFGLTDGQPDAKKILYRADDVAWEDNCWNTHVLTTPVEADGFMIAVSCTGFMGLGYTDADDNYPYTPNTEYYAGDSFQFHISEISTSSFGNNHWMLRAGVELPEMVENTSRPTIDKFIISRYSTTTGEWVKLAETTATTFVDNLSLLEEGRYRWGVEAAYSFGTSSRSSTLTHYNSNSSIDMAILPDASIVYNAASKTLLLIGEVTLESVRVYSMGGENIISTECAGNNVSLSTLAEGLYTIVASLSDGTVIVKKLKL